MKRGYPENPTRVLIVMASSRDDVQRLVLSLPEELGAQGRLPTYVIDGALLGEHAWTFSKMKAHAIPQMMADGQLIASRRLIVPQDHPLILLIENFGLLAAGDQRAFCHLVDGEGGDLSLAAGSLLVCAVYKGREGQIEEGSKSRGLILELEPD